MSDQMLERSLKFIILLLALILLAVLVIPFTAEAQTTKIYRSVQPGNTGAIFTSGGSITLTISGTTATFSSAAPDTVGVGCGIEYDSTGSVSVKALAFITGRTSSTVFTVQRFQGGTPASASATTTWNVRHAYTSLSNWDAGTLNTGFTVTDPDAGNLDIDTRNESWWVSLYAGTESNTTATTTIDGWTTSSADSIYIYTPCSTFEVGTSQRHSGQLTGRCYRITGTTASPVLLINDDAGTKVTQHIHIDGIQLSNSGTGALTGLQIKSENASSNFRISNSIFFGSDSVSTVGTNHIAIDIFSAATSAGVHRIWNNIIYGWKTNGATTNEGGIFMRPTPTAGTAYVFNNTIYKCEVGVKRATAGTLVTCINNIVNRTADGFNGAFVAASDYNISSIAADQPASGANDKMNTTVSFTAPNSGDFSLQSGDTAAKNSGTDLSAAANLFFNYDAKLKTRPASGSASWDIGALEQGATGACRVAATDNPTLLRRRAIIQ